LRADLNLMRERGTSGPVERGGAEQERPPHY